MLTIERDSKSIHISKQLIEQGILSPKPDMSPIGDRATHDIGIEPDAARGAASLKRSHAPSASGRTRKHVRSL
jgi:hypothetical protein